MRVARRRRLKGDGVITGSMHTYARSAYTHRRIVGAQQVLSRPIRTLRDSRHVTLGNLTVDTSTELSVSSSQTKDTVFATAAALWMTPIMNNPSMLRFGG